MVNYRHYHYHYQLPVFADRNTLNVLRLLVWYNSIRGIAHITKIVATAFADRRNVTNKHPIAGKMYSQLLMHIVWITSFRRTVLHILSSDVVPT